MGESQPVTGGAQILDGRRQPSRGGTSRMTRECHVRICERLGVKLPGPTRQRCGNAGARFRQARSREASASEPLQKCRKRIRRCQNRGVTLVWGLFCQGVSGGRRVFLCSIGKPVSSSRPALRSRRRAQELSRLAVAPTLQHGPDHTLTASSTTAPWCGRDDDQRGARFRARINRATTLYPVGSKDPEP